MDINDLLKLIDDDDLGLLKVKPKQVATTTDERLLSSFKRLIILLEKIPESQKLGAILMSINYMLV